MVNRRSYQIWIFLAILVVITEILGVSEKVWIMVRHIFLQFRYEFGWPLLSLCRRSGAKVTNPRMHLPLIFLDHSAFPSKDRGRTYIHIPPYSRECSLPQVLLELIGLAQSNTPYSTWGYILRLDLSTLWLACFPFTHNIQELWGHLAFFSSEFHTTLCALRWFWVILK